VFRKRERKKGRKKERKKEKVKEKKEKKKRRLVLLNPLVCDVIMNNHHRIV